MTRPSLDFTFKPYLHTRERCYKKVRGKILIFLRQKMPFLNLSTISFKYIIYFVQGNSYGGGNLSSNDQREGA